MTSRLTLPTALAGALCLSLGCSDDDDKESTDASRGAAEEGEADDSGDGGTAAARLSFFVTSDTSATGNLGGLSGADARCQRLAEAVGAGERTWRAYLSAEDGPTHARDRIGSGPWYNAKGALLAEDLDALHAMTGDAELFLDEHGETINGQWPGSPGPNEHDVLTGSDAEGRVLAGKTCSDWTSDDPALAARVGHSDGLGPMQNAAAPFNSWNSSHENQSCADTGPRGGAGKLYCFAAD